jgi:hypothetical protein
MGEGELDDFRTGPPLVGDHRHRCLEIGQTAAVIEENSNRHFSGLGNLGKPSRDGFVEIDLTVLDQKMKACRDEGLGAARDPEEIVRPHCRILEFLAEPAREVKYLRAGHADRQRNADHASLDVFIENSLNLCLPLTHDPIFLAAAAWISLAELVDRSL